MTNKDYHSNFSCHILSAVKDDPLRPGDPLVTFALVADGHQLPGRHQLHLREFKSFDFEALDIRCRCGGNRAALGQELYDQARKFIAVHGIHPNYFANTGWAKIDGAPVYVAGNRVLGAGGWVSASQYSLAQNLAGLILEVDDTISELAAAKYVRQLCALAPGVSDMLVAAAVVAHLFSLFEAAGVRPRLVMYLVGPSMVGKTTLARLIGQTYNRSAPDDPHLINLISSTAAVHHHVATLSDCTCVVDDLYPGNSLAESRRREERLGEIIRTTGNGTAKEKMDGKQAISQIPRGVVFATAEYPLTMFSTMARVVSLPMKNPANARAVSQLQENPAILSTFWFYFIQRACKRYEKLINHIRTRFSELRQQESGSLGMDRERDAHRVLRISTEILASYMTLVEPGKAKTIRQTKQCLLRSSRQIYSHQRQELNLLRSRSEHDRFSKFLASLWSSGEFKEGKKKNLGKKYPSIISNEILYIRLDDLTASARKHFSDLSITSQAISAELRRNGLLEMDKSDRSSKKVNGVRYLQIPVERLEEFLPPQPSTVLTTGCSDSAFPELRSN